MTNRWFIPITPGGTILIYGGGGRMGKINAARSRQGAIKNLLEDGAHMPYGTWKNFEKRGYTIWETNMPKGWRP